jgi:hypothetical protein
MKNEKDLKKIMDEFLANTEKPKSNQSLGENNENGEVDCSSGVCIIKNDKSLVERLNKKIITEDGRQLLI